MASSVELTNNYEKIDVTDDCSICLEPLDLNIESESESNIKTLPCGHQLHDECFKGLLESGKNECPLCKKKIVIIKSNTF